MDANQQQQEPGLSPAAFHVACLEVGNQIAHAMRLAVREAHQAMAAGANGGAAFATQDDGDGDKGGTKDAGGGHWITIGGKKAAGPGGKRHGGSPVYIVNGRITKGNPRLTGKRVDALREAPEERPTLHQGATKKERKAHAHKLAGIHRQERNQSRHYERAVWAKKARAAGVDPANLHQLAAEVLAHDKEYASDITRMLQHARKTSAGQYIHGKAAGYDLRGIQQNAGKTGMDYNSIPGFDTTAEAMADAYPHIFAGGRGASSSSEERLWELLIAGNPEAIAEDDAYGQAMEHLVAHKATADAEEVPFSVDDLGNIHSENTGQFVNKTDLRGTEPPYVPHGSPSEDEVDIPKSNTFGAFRAKFVRHPDGTVDIVDTKTGSKASTVHEKSVNRVIDELHGRLTHKPTTASDTVNKVLSGNGKYLGKGHEAMVFDAGDGNVVKAAVLVPFHWNNGVRPSADANKIVHDSVNAGNELIKKGVPGILPQKAIDHEGRAFSVMPKVDTDAKITDKHIEALEQTLKAMHDAGYALRDEVQAGIKDGKPWIFDVGSVGKLEGSDRQKQDDKDHDYLQLSRLADKNGVKYKTPESRSIPGQYDDLLATAQDPSKLDKKQATKTLLHLVGKFKRLDPDIQDFYSDAHAEAEAALRKHLGMPSSG